jgi:hypothetical protein
VEQAEDVEQPEDHHDGDESVEDGLDAGLHGDETVDEPQQDSDNDESNDDLHERHAAHFSSGHLKLIGIAGRSRSAEEE